MSQRTDRVDELLRQEIGAILAREVADPRIGFATVTDVETTRDLSHAKVWVSVIGDTAERRETLEALERAMGFVRRELGVRLHLRRIPALRSTPPDALMSIDLRPLATAVPDAVVERMRVARCVLAIGHESPDADALGAAIAIALLVEARGGRATVAASDAVPDLYRFLEGSEIVRTDPEPGVPYDLVVLCDCGDLSRAGAIRERNAALFAATPLLTIDHHASNDASGALVWIDPGAAASRPCPSARGTPSRVARSATISQVAAALAAGIVMDTAT